MPFATLRKVPAILCLAGLVTLAGCSDDKKATSSSAPAAPSSSAAKSKSAVSETEHEKFEKKYTELCIKGQQSNPDSPVTGDQALGTMCACMAKEISKRLSKAEAVHFLDKKEIPIDLVMMGNAASDICGQK